MRAAIAIALAMVACRPSSQDADAKTARACDPAKIDALVTALLAAEPTARPAIVEGQLSESCQLPPAIASFFPMTAALRHAIENGDLLPAGATEHARAAIATVCGERPNATALLMDAPTEALAAFYDTCDLARFDLVEKGRWVESGPSSVIPFHAYAWLLEQGLAPEQAKAITTPMLLVDRKRIVLTDQAMPKVGRPLPPMPDSTLVYVTATEVASRRASLVPLGNDRRIDESAITAQLVGPLYDELAEDVDLRRTRAPPEKPWDPTLVLVADRSTPMSVIGHVLYTADRAELKRVAFVAETGPLTYGVLTISPPRIDVRTSVDALRAAAGAVGSPVLELEVGKADLEAVADTLEGLTRGNGGRTASVLVRAAPEAEYDAFVQLLASLHASDCDVRKTCPSVLLAVATGSTHDDDPVPGLALGMASFAGARDGDALLRSVPWTLARRVADLRMCYLGPAAAQPDLEGKLVVELVIDAEGSVASASADEVPPALAQVAACVVTLAKTWKFSNPSKRDKVTARIPLTFSPT